VTREERAPEGGRRWAHTIARNVRHHRRLRDLSQQQLADRMGVLGYPWSRATLSDVERHNRELTFDEVAALAVALGAKPLELLDPRGPRGDGGIDLTFGDRDLGFTSEFAWLWLLGEWDVSLERQEDGDGWRWREAMTPDLIERTQREKQDELRRRDQP
jgi:transcriptional regulator with XRE-family HTH domain